MIEQHPLDRLAAFSKYETIRRVNTDLLAELSKSNFVTLSAQAGKPFYEARVRLETKLATYFPQFWRTPYSMIVHSAMPYVQAMRMARRQDRLWNVLGMPLFQLALGALILLQRRFYRIKARSKSSLGVSSILTERKI
jgi:kynurenine 3-monooxygenase